MEEVAEQNEKALCNKKRHAEQIKESQVNQTPRIIPPKAKRKADKRIATKGETSPEDRAMQTWATHPP
eukprot:58408-Karenia_brevis.AAC.1